MRRAEPAARAEIPAIRVERLLHSGAVAEKVRERVRQPEVGGKLRPIGRASEYPERRTRSSGRMRHDAAVRMRLGKRLVAHPVVELLNLARELVDVRVR